MQRSMVVLCSSLMLMVLSACTANSSKTASAQTECADAQSSLTHRNECQHIASYKNANGQCVNGHSICR